VVDNPQAITVLGLVAGVLTFFLAAMILFLKLHYR
jgi:hypothetical protein